MALIFLFELILLIGYRLINHLTLWLYISPYRYLVNFSKEVGLVDVGMRCRVLGVILKILLFDPPLLVI